MNKIGQMLKVNTLGGRLRIFILNLILFIILLTTVFLIYMIRTQISSTFEKELNSIVNMQEQAIEKWLNERELDIRFLSNNYIVNSKSKEEIKTLFENFINSQSEFYTVSLVDTDGYTIVDSTFEFNRYFGDDDFFQEALAGLDSISSAQVSKYENMPVLHFSSPIFDDYGEVSSVIIGAVRLSSIQAIIESFRFSQTGETFIINSNKQLLTKRKFDTEGTLLQKVDNSNITKGFYTSYSNEEVLGDVLKSNFGRWLIVAQISKDEIYEVFEQFLFYVIIFMVVLLIMMVPLILKFSNKIVEPLRFLLHGSYHISNGNYGHEIDNQLISHATVEIKDLTSAFNSMSGVLKNVISELTLQSTIDVLTKLYNRRELLRLSNIEFDKSKFTQKHCAILMIDIDHFKQINDNYGHRTGDIAIESVANVIKTSITNTDIAGRYGGEEFLVFIPETSYDLVYQIAQRIRQNIKSLVIKNEDIELQCTSSVGVFYMNHIKDELNIEYTIELADQALYEAKKSGRDKVIMYQN